MIGGESKLSEEKKKRHYYYGKKEKKAGEVIKGVKPYSKILDTVPYTRGFHFCTASGKSTGVTALGLGDFAEKLKTIDVGSIDFHFRCGDFQKWIRDVLGDDELAEKISQIEKGLCGEDLRMELLETVNSRIVHLKTFH
jgi:Family of unknown function (DUF5752)